MSVQKKVITGISIASILFLSSCDVSSCGSDADVENAEIVARKITYKYYKRRIGPVGLDTFISDSYVVESKLSYSVFPSGSIFNKIPLLPKSKKYNVYFSYSDDLSGEVTYRWAMVFLGKCNDYHDHFSREITKQEFISITQNESPIGATERGDGEASKF